MHEQNLLPPTMKFKSAALFELIQMTIGTSQLLYKNNRDFVSLPADARSTLLHSAFKHT
jgi:hypothetical protein